ncbi:MAG TPA: hypothetical protein VH501_06495 [Solirubrobacterales bacterium]|jgi:hypothetical protein
MNEEIAITFDDFGWEALEERAAAQRVSLEELLSLALGYYDSELPSGRAATVVPRFRGAPAEGETRTLTLRLEEGTMPRLRREAERRGVALERVCEHAALLFLADLDSGKVAEEVVRRARSKPGPGRPSSA